MRELFTADFSGLFILLLGVMGMAGEWRHRTITSSVLAAPDRLRLLAAKTARLRGRRRGAVADRDGLDHGASAR